MSPRVAAERPRHASVLQQADNTTTRRDKQFMDSLIPEVEKGVQGRRVQSEDEDDSDN